MKRVYPNALDISYGMMGDYGQAVQMADRLRLDTVSLANRDSKNGPEEQP